MMNTSEKLFIGIDVSKDTLEVALDSTSKTQTLNNTSQGIVQLVKLIKACSDPIGVVLLEATGGLEHECALALCLADVPVIVVNPRQSHDFAKAMGYLAKTDALDARVLSHFAQTLHGNARYERMLFKMPSQEQATLEALVVRRSQLIGMRAAESNRVHTAHQSQQRSIKAVLKVLTHEMAQIDDDIERHLGEHFAPKLALLKGIKGVGTGTQAAHCERHCTWQP